MGPAALLATIVVCIVLERIARFRYRNSALFRDYFTSDLAYLVIALIFGLWTGLVYVAPLTNWIESQVAVPRLAHLAMPRWVLVPAALILVDLGNWLAHYFMHRSDALWELHKVHHSSRVVDWLATFRSHIGEQALRNVVGPVFLIAAGFPLDVTLFATGLYGAFGVFQHSNTRLNLRALEGVFVTPRLHRMHHLPGGTCQRNFGTVLTLWDRLAGTYERADCEDNVFGVPGEIESYPQTWLPQMLEPFRRLIARLSFQHD